LKDDFMTSFIPVITLINKRQLRSHLLNLKQGVDDYLIKPPDPLDLRIRVEMAIKRAQYSSFSSPLTGLPGGRIIEETLRERLTKNVPFSFGYLDLDNFKYFNDGYGYLKGDRVIMQTAYMLYTVIKKFGQKGDFIGHIGGDDFAFITGSDRYNDVCREFILTFDKIMPFHYSEVDRKNGFIVARNRAREVKEIPLLSVSIAVVNHSKPPDDFKSIIEVNDRIAEIKRYLKGFPGSKFMADRRNGPRKAGGGPEIHGRDSKPGDDYAPLGELLVRKNLILRDKLEDALPVHWRKGMMLGQTLVELGILKREDLAAVLCEPSGDGVPGARER